MPKDLSGLNVLVCDKFWYFGCKAKKLPKRFLGVVKSGPGHKIIDDVGFVTDFDGTLLRRSRRFRCRVHEPIGGLDLAERKLSPHAQRTASVDNRQLLGLLKRLEKRCGERFQRIFISYLIGACSAMAKKASIRGRASRRTISSTGSTKSLMNKRTTTSSKNWYRKSLAQWLPALLCSSVRLRPNRKCLKYSGVCKSRPICPPLNQSEVMPFQRFEISMALL
jgi:hypothetical protein